MISAEYLNGWWRRVWLKTPDFEDMATQVTWAQAEEFYVDLRIPAETFVGDTVADLDDKILLIALTAEGFAGRITVDDSVCTWRRTINWHGASDVIDAGRLRFGEDGDLYEDGVHVTYSERWTRTSKAAPVGHRLFGGGLAAFLISTDTDFAFGAGHPDAPGTEPMIDALQSGRRTDALTAHFETEYMLGHWEGDKGVIDLSTTPLRSGEIGLRRGAGITWMRRSLSGGLAEVSLS